MHVGCASRGILQGNRGLETTPTGNWGYKQLLPVLPTFLWAGESWSGDHSYRESQLQAAPAGTVHILVGRGIVVWRPLLRGIGATSSSCWYCPHSCGQGNRGLETTPTGNRSYKQLLPVLPTFLWAGGGVVWRPLLRGVAATNSSCRYCPHSCGQGNRGLETTPTGNRSYKRLLPVLSTFLWEGESWSGDHSYGESQLQTAPAGTVHILVGRGIVVWTGCFTTGILPVLLPYIVSVKFYSYHIWADLKVGATLWDALWRPLLRWIIRF